MHLNHSQTILPSPAHGKIVFRETGPWWGTAEQLLGSVLPQFPPLPVQGAKEMEPGGRAQSPGTPTGTIVRGFCGKSHLALKLLRESDGCRGS